MGVYYFECGIDGGFEKEHSSGDPRNPCPLCRIAELEAEVERMENLLAEGIHTCNPTCKRPLCVLRRENKELREELEVANEIGARHAKRVGEQAIELQALREAVEAIEKERGIHRYYKPMDIAIDNAAALLKK